MPALLPFMNPHRIEAGCDEAGRGCLAGPVVAAAVILPPTFYHRLLNDSKQLTEGQRNMLRPYIEEQALAWAVAFVEAQEIDSMNILRASITAMHRALDQLTVRPEFILVDGNKFYPYRVGAQEALLVRADQEVPHQCVVKGDSTYASIAAASVLAKTHRDAYMEQQAQKYPHYGWDKNKGYPTAFHRQAVLSHGITPLHRKTFTCKSI